METITFYSYKGGVGRTLALANIACYLSRFGQNVCIMDFDLEAPGLHHKFPKLLKKTEIKKGLVDYIHEFTCNKVIPQSLTNYSLTVVPKSKALGGIKLIPAGNVKSTDYWRKLASIDWHNLFYKKDSEGVFFFLELKERIEREIKPDFLLIDSRTGITETSGICTSLFPDKVVFLTVNNLENIEGARQIFQSIQKIEQLERREVIKVVFALTRIPFPKNEDEEKREKEIINQIKTLLNEPVEDLERQLNVENICVLHSDRELELSESLRISEEGISEETPLSRDYLRLFSKIIPEQILAGKFDTVIDKIIADMWNNPDKTQEELEELVTSYPYVKSIEKLIDFYFIRNEKEEKILSKFDELWEISGTLNQQMLSKYVSMFMRKEQFYAWTKPYNLEIIEKYIKLKPNDVIQVELKLAKAYEQYGKSSRALKHYYNVLNLLEEKEQTLAEILDIHIHNKSYEKAIMLLEQYPNVIDSASTLRVKKIEILSNIGRIDEIKELLDTSTERILAEEDPSLYFEVMQSVGRLGESEKKLNSILTQALRSRSRKRILETGKLYYSIDRANEFDNKLRGNHPEAERIIRELKRRYRRY